MRTVNLEVAVAGVSSLAAVDWSRRVDALARGEIDEDDFMDELWSHASVTPDVSWEAAALLDKSFRMGQLPVEVFRSTAAKIARRLLAADPNAALALMRTMRSPSVTAPASVPARNPIQVPTLSLTSSPGVNVRGLNPPDRYLPGVNSPVSAAEAHASSGAGASPAELAVGSVLRERYVIDSCVGRGGMGVVYKAIDEFRREHGEIDCHVAIKVLHPANEARPEALARLRREFYAAQALSHENVVNVFELDRDGDLDFFTMEYLEGELLSAVLLQFAGRPLPRAAAWSIIRQIGEGIAHAHERNVVHADLKPHNIMLTQTGQVRILDFGASSDSGRVPGSQRAPRNNPLALTPAYASCELLAGKRADPRDDLYALACLSCELLAGQHPFWHQRSTEARMAQAVPTRPPNLTDRQWRTLQRGLAWDREHRSISVRDWLAALNPQATTIDAIPRPVDLPGSPPPPPPARVSAKRIAAALALFLACLSAWAIFNRPARIAMTASAVAAPAALATPDSAAEVATGAVPAAAAAARDATAESVPSRPAFPPAAAAPRAAGAGPRIEKIDLTSASYTLPPGTKFAEIRVRRNRASRDQASFEWWTEESTALPGIDFVTQPRVKVTFLPGSRTASLFVKVLDDAARTKPAKFDVVIGGASNGTVLGISRAEVTLQAGR
jgi:hypothetical protein